jgi:hypothetical protein
VAGATPLDHSIGVVLDTGCPPDPNCLAQATTPGTVANISGLSLPAGTYYLMIDRQPDQEGIAVLDFRLTIADCPAAIGACCLPGGGCAQVTEADCISANGLSWSLATPCSPQPCPVGDADGDGDVDLDDLLLVLGNFGDPGPGSLGDTDGDGDTDLDDLLLVLGNFGT